jgi:predicted O-linked N-acetylglucosamine transferase (SPINDLY family)
MEQLSRSDLVLQSFPFGGTNTVMDALAAGIPMVCMEGQDLDGAADPLLLRHGGLGELVAGSATDYVALAISLLADPRARERIGAQAVAALPRLQALQASGGVSMADAVRQAWEARDAR